MEILIVDDDSLVIESLEILLSADRTIRIAGSAANGSEAIEFVRSHTIDVILMDIRMPVMDGIQATKQIKQIHPDIKVIMLTTYHDYRNIHRSLQAGASGYLLKSDETSSQIRTIKAVYEGLPVISEVALKEFSNTNISAELTRRENEILVNLANGLSNKEIAERLFISEGTARNTISTILDKLQLRDRTQLAIYYRQNIGDR
ncbi:MAG: DNA-binding response regulator [Spirochaetaceae bacterium]|nr:MAG: DNA-binding response regulator [Spirochaetaceae bacterium]